MAIPQLILDPSLKYWVLIPISITMILFTTLRQLLNSLLTPTAKLQPIPKIRESETLKKVQLFKQNNYNLPQTSFESKREHLQEVLSNGSLLPPVDADKDGQPQQPPNPLSDPATQESMLNMAKSSMGNMVAQYLIMGWVNFFYTGLILMKLPFPLTFKFKSMLQTGILTADLDVSWVSSISWYFLSVMGINSVYNVLINGDGEDVSGLQQQQPQGMPFGAGAGGGLNNRDQLAKAFEGEVNNLRIINHEDILANVENRVLALYG